MYLCIKEHVCVYIKWSTTGVCLCVVLFVRSNGDGYSPVCDLVQLKQQWGEKYAEWMAETERKLAELQQANDLM